MAITLNGIDSIARGGAQGGFIDTISTGFDTGLVTLRGNLLDAHEKLVGKASGTGGANVGGDPGNPGVLAEYQKASSEYQLYRNAQSSAVKMYRDLAQGTISKWS